MTAPRNAFEWSKAYFQSGDRRLHKTHSVMAALMTYANFDTLVCWPSQETLAKVTGLSVDSVRRHLRVNVSAGWLKVLRKGVAVGSATLYQLTIPTDSLQHCQESDELLAGLPETPSSTAGLTPSSTATLTTNRTTQGTTHIQPGLGGPGVVASSSPSVETRHVPTPSSTARGCLALLADAIRASEDGRVAAQSAAGIMQVPSDEAKRLIHPAIDRGEFLLIEGEYGKYLEIPKPIRCERDGGIPKLGKRR